jgi:sulfate adenylyltransferase subunit 1 (EFTu-like GTPase family)
MTSALKFITCGSVDDGKSTLIGRLLVDTKAVLQDHLAGVQRKGETDLALLTDGLSAEREQGITIDVAYRYFNTEARKFIIGDAPGHEQYTRNMVTAASSADAAVVLVDATKLDWKDANLNLLAQTRRHSLLWCLPLTNSMPLKMQLLLTNTFEAPWPNLPLKLASTSKLGYPFLPSKAGTWWTPKRTGAATPAPAFYKY